MTIAVGFLCGGGNDLIIGADRQITSQGAFKSHEEKVSGHQSGFQDIVCAYSGEPGTFLEFEQKVFGYLDQEEVEWSIELLQNTIEGVLGNMGLRDRYLNPSFQLLIGFSELFAPPRMLVFDGHSVFQASAGLHIIGCGDTSLIRYLRDHLYRSAMSKEYGQSLAAYLIKKATQYVDGCGEPIDVHWGSAMGFEAIENDRIQAGIRAIEGQEGDLFTSLVQKAFEI